MREDADRLQNALQGREICSLSTRLANRANPPTAPASEWARFVDASPILQGLTADEEFHPNAYGSGFWATAWRSSFLVPGELGGARVESRSRR